MTKSIRAAYANGVFRPVEPVDLPEQTPVEFELQMAAETPLVQQLPSKGLSEVYEVFCRRHRLGFNDTAARHNEHAP